MSVKINSLEFENVKKIKAVQLEPAKNGLTVIGGKNRQGRPLSLTLSLGHLGEISISRPLLSVRGLLSNRT